MELWIITHSCRNALTYFSGEKLIRGFWERANTFKKYRQVLWPVMFSFPISIPGRIVCFPGLEWPVCRYTIFGISRVARYKTNGHKNTAAAMITSKQTPSAQIVIDSTQPKIPCPVSKELHEQSHAKTLNLKCCI